MANIEKNIWVTPNNGSSTADPKIVFSGADASTAAQNITLQVYPTNGGTLSFEGSTGQLFSIANTMTGTIFSANDISGIPSIEVLDTGLIKLGQYGGNVVLGSGTDAGKKLQVYVTTNTDGIAIKGGVGATNTSLILNNTGTGGNSWDISSTAGGHGLGDGKLLIGNSFSPKVTINGSGNVGIGTTSPGYLLHVESANANYSAVILNTLGEATGNGLFVQTRWNVASNYVARFTTNSGNTDVLAIKGDGNVGIGTTAPNSRLDITASPADPSSVSNAAATVAFRTTGHVQLAINTQAASPYTTSLQAKHTSADGNTYPIALNPLGGNVGIGTVNPDVRLNVYVPPTTGFVDAIKVGGTSNYSSLLLGLWGAYDAAISTTGNDLHILAGRGVASENHNIKFYTSFINASGQAENNQRMLIRYDGDVGIGTNGPTARLHVVTTAQNNGITVTGPSTGFLNICPDATSGAWNNLTQSHDVALIYGNATGLTIAPWVGASQGMRLDGSGNVSIGTVTPNEKLEVAGNIIIGSTNWLYGWNASSVRQPLIRSKGMGYSQTGYPGVQIGQTGDHIALFIDPGTIAGGSFNGSTNELVIPNTMSILQANSGGSDWIGCMTFSNGTVSFSNKITASISGNCDGSAGSVAWTNVSSRPTNLSSFTNDLGNYGSWITASGSITGNAATVTNGMYLTGAQTISAGVKDFVSGSGCTIAYTGGSANALEAYGAGGGAAMMSFHRPGSYAVYFGLDTDNVLRVGGWSMGDASYTIYHSGNIPTWNQSTTGNAATATTATNLNGGTCYTSRLTFTGVGGDSGQSFVANHYSIGQASGAWTHPYPDLIIGYHTGIRIGALNSYGGTRFYNNSPTSDGSAAEVELMSIGNGDNHIRISNNLYVTGDITAYYSSDRNLKTNIEVIPNAINKIKQISGITFDWNEAFVSENPLREIRREAGIIAQEVQEVLPEIVTTRENGYLAVKYEKLTPLLIEAIKEQQGQIELLQQQVKSLLALVENK